MRIHFLSVVLLLLSRVIVAEDASREVKTPETDAAALVERVVSTQARDVEKTKTLTCSGIAEYLSVDESINVSWDFTYRHKEKSDWLEFLRRDRFMPGRADALLDFEAFRYVSDGESLVEVCFGERIHPSGCQLTIYEDKSNVSLLSPLGFHLDLRKFFLPPMMRSTEAVKNFFTDDVAVTIVEANVLRVSYKSGICLRITISAEQGDRIVQVELGTGPQGKPSKIYRYDWVANKDDWDLREVIVQQRDFELKEKFRTQRIIIESIAFSLDPAEDDFGVASLQPEPRSIVIERRNGKALQVRNVDLPIINSAERADSLRTVIEKLPLRR